MARRQCLEFIGGPVCGSKYDISDGQVEWICIGHRKRMSERHYYQLRKLVDENGREAVFYQYHGIDRDAPERRPLVPHKRMFRGKK